MDPGLYFNRIATEYTERGHDVFCPSVQPVGSLQERTKQLAVAVLQRWPDDGQPIYLLAHSMGGLDCRRMLAVYPDIARRVPRLITIATPHFGSPVANAALKKGFLGFPTPAELLTAYLADYAGALADLTRRSVLQNGPVNGFKGQPVDYVCIGCNAAATYPRSPVFVATAFVGGFGKVPNDGVVSLDSSSRTNKQADLFAVWPVDHGGAIGWPSGLPFEAAEAAASPPADHLARYVALLGPLLK